MTRYFAFGCSYVQWKWPVIPDFIAANFDQYYNCGRSGCSHQFILNNIVKIHEKYKFNPSTDYITVGTTGFYRFDYPNDAVNYWQCHGDTYPGFDTHPEKSRIFSKNFDSYKWSIVRSLQAIKIIRLILNAIGVKYTIYHGVENHFNRLNLTDNEFDYYNEFIENLDIKESIDYFIIRTMCHEGMPEYNLFHGMTFDNGDYDSHPGYKIYYNYFKEHFPQFDTDLSRQRFQYLDQNFDSSSMSAQAEKYNKFLAENTVDHKIIRSMIDEL